ncbi:MAG: molybdenum cofactor guanylyltransferase MobA [Emcibacteraceae bacterium]|nr:molybdenum cofactor guanylyltransferase MobA [Emcibacteraceae bacterium]MDG1857711.1 molybdenum cofactor guanylyltransferase MobA [Emcibacteraceae bacterium]
MPDQSTLLGVILAGGMSRRMGGNDKFLETLDEDTIFNHIISRFSSQVEKLVINHNKSKQWEDIEVVSDIILGAGPLGGIHAVLNYAKEKGFDRIVTVPCDTPFIPMDYVSRLFECDKPLVIASSRNRIHPVLALWHISLLDKVANALEKGDLKLMNLIKGLDHEVVNWEDAPDPFFNINTPEDLLHAKEVVLKDQ